jgi:arginyl-tRNA synthetase
MSIADTLAEAIASVLDTLGIETRPEEVHLERPARQEHGDFSTNIALASAKRAGRNPRELADQLTAALLAAPPRHVESVEVAGPGFVNFKLRPSWLHEAVAEIVTAGESGYATPNLGHGERVQIEFVSANPTGPLTVAHGRHAAYGATLANLLAAVGFRVHREFYVNDAGRQMDILAVSVWLRYLQACGESLPFPANGYQGEYLRPIAVELQDEVGYRLRRSSAEVLAGLPQDESEGGDKETYIDALIERARQLIGAEALQHVLDLARERLLDDMREDLREFGVVFDRWYSERSLATSGAIERALQRLEREGSLYRQDGAVWFRATAFGDEKDRVVVRENGQKTYFASDIAYHLDKRERGFEQLIDVLGSGHHGYIARVRAGLAAMGEPPDSLEVPLIQVVTLYRGNVQIPMSKRAGQFVTLRELRGEVGNDACRFFYLMRGHEQPLDFDLELATARTNENPVYYIQYAHARGASVMKQLAARGLAFDRTLGLASLELLTSEHEQALMTMLARYPEMVEQAAANRAPQTLVHFLRELANAFHAYYNAERFIVEDARLRAARLTLVTGAQQVVRNGLALLGVSAPESM